ncbi:unnamed protein product [Schistocephalus solidus]|uniref:Nucleolar protein 6 n=1 Tax=Schistocephalus solidus TaxID=70667 RepID=A0A183T3M1_SCHSO|nr:unnamed protein product [Schistocephalus solidus]
MSPLDKHSSDLGLVYSRVRYGRVVCSSRAYGEGAEELAICTAAIIIVGTINRFVADTGESEESFAFKHCDWMDPLEEFDHLKKLPSIGLRLDPSLAHSLTIRGPPSGTEAGKNFRQFWGSKSELRHVDGDLFECVVWESSQNVTLQIVDHLLARHFKLGDRTTSRNWYQVTSDRLNSLLASFAPAHTVIGFPPRASSLHLIRTVDRLNSVLQDLNSHLPLNIVGVQAISSEFRDTSVFPPVLTVPRRLRKRAREKKTKTFSWKDVLHTLQPIYIIINIESSGKWPRDNLDAFLHMKRLFLLRVNELLCPKGIPSRVVDNGMLDIFLGVNFSRLSKAVAVSEGVFQYKNVNDVSVPSSNKIMAFVGGLVLRVSFYQPLELLLLKRATGLLPNSKQARSKQESLPGTDATLRTPADLQRWLLFNERLPAVTSQLNTISRVHLNIFPEACRLAKRWLSGHGLPVVRCPELGSEPRGLPASRPPSLLGDNDFSADFRLSEIAVELMIVYAGFFTKPVRGTLHEEEEEGPFGVGGDEAALPSASPLATFLRFLRLLSTFDWMKRPLVIDLNDDFIEGDGPLKVEAALKDFYNTPRGDLPAVVIITPLDLAGTDWTQSGPSIEGLARLQLLAKRSHDLLRAMLVAGAHLADLKAVFRPDLSEMDVLLTTKPPVFQTRLLENLDVDTPTYLSKVFRPNRPADLSSLKQARKEPPPVSLEILDPGAGYWPDGYLCDPLLWLMRQLKTKFGDLFHFFWDRHSARWLGLKLKQPDKFATLTAFSEENLRGFSCHRAPAEAPSDVIGLAADIPTLLKMLRLWSADFVDSVSLQCLHREVAGRPVSLDTEVEVAELIICPASGRPGKPHTTDSAGLPETDRAGAEKSKRRKRKRQQSKQSSYRIKTFKPAAVEAVT